MLLPKQRLGFLGLLVWDWGFRGTGRRSELTYQVICWVFWGFRFGTGALGGQAEGQSFNHPYQRLGFYGALGLGLGDFRLGRFGTGALGGQGEGQSFRNRLGLGEGQNTVLGLGGSGWRLGEFNRLGFGLHVSTGPQLLPMATERCFPFSEADMSSN